MGEGAPARQGQLCWQGGQYGGQNKNSGNPKMPLVVHAGHIRMGSTNIPVFFLLFFLHNLMPDERCGSSTLQDAVK